MIFVNMLRSRVRPSVDERVYDATYTDPGAGSDAALKTETADAMKQSVMSDCIAILDASITDPGMYLEAELAMEQTLAALKKLRQAIIGAEKLSRTFKRSV